MIGLIKNQLQAQNPIHIHDNEHCISIVNGVLALKYNRAVLQVIFSLSFLYPIKEWNLLINKTVRLLFFALFLGMTACAPTTDPSSHSNESQLPTATSSPDNAIFFPRQRKTNGEWAAMSALTRGTLVFVNKCIRLERGRSLDSYLLIWPPEYNLSNANGIIQIINEDGNIVASIGDRVEMSGGEIHLISMLDGYIQEQVPPQCTGPYWIIGYEFAMVNP